MTKARKQPFAFARESAQSQSNDSEGHLNPFLNFLALAGPRNRRSGLRITIQPQDDATTDLGTDPARLVLTVLRNALIRTRGGGRFADSSAATILASETDAPEALAALKQAGIRALIS